MGIDFHIGGHYFGFHVPELVLLLLAGVALYVAVRLVRHVLAAS